MEKEIDAFYDQLFGAFDAGKPENAIVLYEPTAVWMMAPGKVARGLEEIRQGLLECGRMQLKITPLERKHLIAGDTALVVIKWTSSSVRPDGTKRTAEGIATDVIRRQPDGRWLYLVDNPYGTNLQPNEISSK